MKVKHKALLILGSGILLLIAITYGIFRFTYFGYIEKQHEQEIGRNFQVVSFIINNEEQNLKRTLVDWAYWDDTYEFLKNINPVYIASNLQDNTLTTLNLKMMVFLDNQGKSVYNKSYNLDKTTSDGLKNIIKTGGTEVKSGLSIINNRAFIVSVAPVTDSKMEKDSIGSLVFIREVDDKILSYIQNVTGVTLKYTKYEGNKIVDDIFKIREDQKLMESGRIIKDINGESSILMSVMKVYDNNNVIDYYFRIFIIHFLVMLGVILIFGLVIANKYILKRLFMVDDFMNKVAATKDTTLSLNMTGSDEFYTLATSINNMLLELNSAYKDMKEMDKRFRTIMEATNDGYLDFHVKNKEVYISPEWKRLIGYTGDDGNQLYDDFKSRIHPDFKEHLKKKFDEVVDGNVEYFEEEYKVIKDNGDIMWVLQRGKVAQKDTDGKPGRIVCTLSDITDRKKYEEEILFLSYSDRLTGLRNRVYMEKQLESLDDDAKSRYFIIMGDLNGLKIVNDSMGHKEGDRLIKISAGVLSKVCEDDDIASRWGGDEFIILIKNKDIEYVQGFIDHVREEFEKITEFHLKISIALGYAEKLMDDQNSELIMNLAEKRMYRNKLMENKSARNATISTLLRTLHEKHSETEEHTMRIKNFSLMLGKRLGLPQDMLDELELLALLHDIGKIGIPEQILAKSSKLSEEEWNVMKSHTEIGYRIAKSTPELSHIADGILTHHEKYDGTGYPKGLSGNDIPILSRIINIVDSFDVMTHKRVYKEAMNFDYAIEELKRCSNTQFDPYIVSEFICLIEEDSTALEVAADIS